MWVKPEYCTQSVLINVDRNKIAFIKEGLEAVIRYHDVLRSVWIGDKLVIRDKTSGRLLEFYEFYNSTVEFSNEEIISKCKQIQNSFEIGKGPMLKAAVYESPENTYLYLCAHHLVIDTLSWNILLNDLQLAVDCLENNKKIEFREKTASYKKWESYLQEYCASERCLKQKDFWKQVYKTLIEWRYPTEFTGKTGRERISVVLDEKLSDSILYKLNGKFSTMPDELILAALTITVHKCTGLQQTVVVVEENGRQNLHENIRLDRTVGWFTNTYPVVLPVKQDTKETIIHVKDTIREIKDKGMAWSMHFGENVDLTKCISFNYLGNMDQDLHYNRLSLMINENDIAPENSG